MNRNHVSELRKALATTGSGQYLVPEDLEPRSATTCGTCRR